MPFAAAVAVALKILLLWTPNILHALADTPALFVFGDSLVDAGNNNFLNTRSRANFPPFGMNFDQHVPTGRFTDGRIIPDYIADFLGLNFPPAYLGAGNAILSGANFGSGGSGIHNTTGAGMGDHAPLIRQIQYFRTAKQRLESALGTHNASRLISKSIFYFTTGNNDFANNYYRSPDLQRNFTLPQFEDLLVSIVERQIKELYSLHARKFVITSVAALGCNPMSLYIYQVNTPGECAAEYDAAARSYNQKLQNMLGKLRSSLSDSHIVYANLYGIMTEVIRNGTAYGFPNVNMPCCPFNGRVECYFFAPTCSNASEHVFWDLFHLTGKFNQLVANRFWNGNKSDVFPMNIRRLSRF